MITACDGRIKFYVLDKEFFGVQSTYTDCFSTASSMDGFYQAAKKLSANCDAAIAYYQQLKQDAEQLASELEIKENAE